ncbi:Putative polyketide-based spore pigment synthesis protein [Kitasatospora sp. MMS16-BH015]|uniref:SchA/CurD-like domain-containing protein n=1 Tax=Kitasatospora sp. MMS16-BH015 TaxID=2018025 RepID=UPI000CA1A939|nr:SchA/CurD-like domain-containing protein [Kitasatospora sp. MMS16-BH015]AUG78304.1 Putative polyketide-based spore pigment synthesis protein [Kitasatospora sp. MMS16-BH015]
MTTPVSTLTHSPAGRSAATRTRLRVVLLCDVMDGAQQRFLAAYEQLRHQVAAVPGHVTDQLCQSIEDPSQWLITSEWESAQPFLAWVDSEAHRAMVRPLHGCVRDTRSLRFSIMRETSGEETFDSTQAPVLDGTVRHALTFTVKPGSEPEVARILSGYSSPAARVDDHTRLLRTSLFLRGNRVVRSVEVEGDLAAALRHVAAQPEVRAVEEAINPYLEQHRDLADPESARAFFMRAALPAVHHTAAEQPRGTVTRYALQYPVRPGCGAAVAALLARQDALAVREGGHPFAGSTVFQREDTVVRVVDLTAEPETVPALALGVVGPRAVAVLARLTAPVGHDLRTPAGLARFAADCSMALLTDRRAKDA